MMSVIMSVIMDEPLTVGVPARLPASGRAREHNPSLLGQRGHREEPIESLTDAVIKE